MSLTRNDLYQRVRTLLLGGAVVFVTAVAPGETRAQEMNGQGGEEIRLLREAAAREDAGDHAGAERILRTVLESRPNSLSAIISFERVLRVQGRLEELIPAVDRLLAIDPRSAIGHQMRIRTLSHLDRIDELRAAAAVWIRVMPKVETPYREIAHVWRSRGDLEEARSVLERGRSRLERKDALALELGDVYAGLGDDRRAVREWDRAIGPDGRGFPLVRRRLSALPDGGARLLPALIDALTQAAATPARLRAAAELAIDAGLGDRAEPIARRVAPALAPAERESFFVEVARRADGARLPALAYWAYSALLDEGAPDRRLLAVRSRLGDLALALGDTTAAMEHLLIVEKAYAVGSPERRKAGAVRIELTAREGEVEEAQRELEAFRREFAEAPELDAVVAVVADLLLERGDAAGAERLLGTISGPRSGMVRGRIALRQGDIARARTAFLSAAPGLQGAEATEIIALATLLGRLTPAGGRLLGQAMARAGERGAAEAVSLLVDESGELGRAERAAILDFAAGLAERAGLPAEAEQIRRTIIGDLADAPEAPAALLALARALADRAGGLEEARQLLERLVLDHPRSALVPQARRELDRLQGRVPISD